MGCYCCDVEALLLTISLESSKLAAVALSELNYQIKRISIVKKNNFCSIYKLTSKLFQNLMYVDDLSLDFHEIPVKYKLGYKEYNQPNL